MTTSAPFAPTTDVSSTSSLPNAEGLFTRADYMSDRCSFEQYYGQFVTPGVTRLVRSFIGEDAILRSTDPHFNDIPLKQWDNLNELMKGECGGLKRHAEPVEGKPNAFNWALSDTVCIAKEAARRIKAAAPAVVTTVAPEGEAAELLNADQVATEGLRTTRRPGL